MPERSSAVIKASCLSPWSMYGSRMAMGKRLVNVTFWRGSTLYLGFRYKVGLCAQCTKTGWAYEIYVVGIFCACTTGEKQKGRRGGARPQKSPHVVTPPWPIHSLLTLSAHTQLLTDCVFGDPPLYVLSAPSNIHYFSPDLILFLFLTCYHTVVLPKGTRISFNENIFTNVEILSG